MVSTCKTAQMLLGVGGQKCGTTWVYRQLMRQAWFAHGDRKEYRIFEQPNYNLEAYARSFRRLLKDQANTSVCADITPAYALLEEDDLIRLRQALEAQQFRVRALFVMRDPLERVWSQVRMHRAKGASKGQDPYRSDQEGLEDMFCRRYVEGRTRYQVTVKRLEQVFPPADLMLTIYEQMFSNTFAIRLGQWLEKPVQPLLFQERIHSTNKQDQLTEAIQSEVAHHFQDVYAWAEERFGTQMHRLWGGYKWLR